jgi:hypothetical protein
MFGKAGVSTPVWRSDVSILTLCASQVMHRTLGVLHTVEAVTVSASKAEIHCCNYS